MAVILALRFFLMVAFIVHYSRKLFQGVAFREKLIHNEMTFC